MPSPLFALLAIPGVALVTLGTWLRHINRGLCEVPDEALGHSPHRWTTEEIRKAALDISETPLDTVPYLPRKTGRRYIVVGGSGLVGGWIVRHLVARGEDPHNIRIISRQKPTRNDIHADKVSFVGADICDIESLRAAFNTKWPPSSSSSGITVFHAVAAMRYYERHQMFVSRSSAVNVDGTKNVVSVAKETLDVEILIYTSSGSIPARRSNFWIPPWRRYAQSFVQVIGDNSPITPQQDAFTSNYGYTKYLAENIVIENDDPDNGFRTGCLRPGLPIYGQGGDMSVGLFLLRRKNPSWMHRVIQSMIYVENASYAHLLYELHLVESLHAPRHSHIHKLAAQAYTVSDPNPISYEDLFLALTTLTNNQVQFPRLPAVMMLVLASLIEKYYILQAKIPRLLPSITGDIVALQPSIFDLASSHVILDDSRARLPPEKGGIGYHPPWTTLQGVCHLVQEHMRGIVDAPTQMVIHDPTQVSDSG